MFGAFLILIGCAEIEIKDKNARLLTPGTWYGVLKYSPTKKIPGLMEDDTYKIIVLTCNPIPAFWVEEDDGQFHQYHTNYSYKNESGSALYSIIGTADDGGWVEIRSWALVSISENKSALQWNRMVSNPHLDTDDILRSFGQLGYAELTKISDDCKIRDPES